MDEITVDVTSEDILCGCRANCINCPIARAIDRVIPQNYHASVLYGHANIYLTETCLYKYSYTLPREARSFIEDFDSGNKVSPFSFKATKNCFGPYDEIE